MAAVFDTVAGIKVWRLIDNCKLTVVMQPLWQRTPVLGEAVHNQNSLIISTYELPNIKMRPKIILYVFAYFL